MLGHRQGVKHASPFDALAVVWHPFGQATGMTPHPDEPAVGWRTGHVILRACPSGEDRKVDRADMAWAGVICT
jgi:hypothetical protein